MSRISSADLIAFVAGSLAGESPLCVEDAVAASLRLVDELDEHGWVVVDETLPLRDDDRIDFAAGAVPTLLVVNGTTYDVVERTAELAEIGVDVHHLLAERAALVAEVERLRAGASVDVAEPEVDEDLSDVETSNDHMVAATIAEPRKISWLGSDGVSQEAALRHAAWIVALADPLEQRFPKVLRAVMST